jgi:hypothetical protein
MKIYIAGKISGLVYEDAYCAFVEAEQVLKRLGHEPVNPMKENGLDGDGNEYAWAEYMKRDIPHLLACDGIYLLKNWRDSKGAKIESQLARDLEMKVLFEDHVNCSNCTEPILHADATFIRDVSDVVCEPCFDKERVAA